MITSTTASAALSVATGLIKLGQRLDRLLAEKAAVQAKLVVVMPAVYQGPSSLQKAEQLRKYLAAPAGPIDPLGSDRTELAAELKKNEPDNALIGECYQLVFPERLNLAPFSPDAAYVAALRALLPEVDLSNEDTLAATFAITAGHDDRGINYSARIGLLVVDVVAEFGAENSARFVRDARLRSVAESVLQRFAQPDLENFTQWSPLLRHALNATLNGALDARGSLSGDHPWLTSLLEVLAAARADPAGGDDFLVGLFRGQSGNLLLSEGLTRAATVLGEDRANDFKQIAAAVLKEAAPLARKSPDFKATFSAHWGDLLRAGLTALERQGPSLLKNQSALVSDVLVAMVKQLNEIPQANLLGPETLFRLGDAAISAVAAKPELLAAQVENKPWLRVFLESFVKTAAREGLQASFSKEGLEALTLQVAQLFSAHPELIGDPAQAQLGRQILGGILKAASELPALDAQSLATAATLGTVNALASQPGLLGTRYAQLIVDFSARLAELIKGRSLSAIDAAALAEAATQVLRRNPNLFSNAKGNLAIVAVDAILRAAGDPPAGLLKGGMLVETVRATLIALARHGEAKFLPLAREAATDLLAAAVRDALVQATAELGRRIDVPGLPVVLSGLIAAWARGDLPKIDPASPAFREILNSLVSLAATPSVPSLA